MASLNQVNLIGRLGRDPEYRIGGRSGKGFTTMSIATTHHWRDDAGAQQSETEWHRIVLGGKLAETARDYLVKRRLVFVSGRLRTRKYEKDGRDVYITEVVAEQLQMLDKPPSDQALSDEHRQFVGEMADPDVPF
ncbi:MAG: single-stranded DNA-binding protein [Lautropia sp.]